MWTYDQAGNILSRTEYDYTTGSLDAPGVYRRTVLYGYSTGGWGDLLVSYKGISLDYNNGCLAHDGAWHYIWERPPLTRGLAFAKQKTGGENIFSSCFSPSIFACGGTRHSESFLEPPAQPVVFLYNKNQPSRLG